MKTSNHDGMAAYYRPLIVDLQTHVLQMRTIAETMPESESSQAIYDIGRHSLRQIDYALYALDAQQIELPLSTVSTTAIAHDVCQDLQIIAKQYRADVQLNVVGHPAAAFTNAQAVHGAMYSLASSIIMAIQDESKDRSVILHVRQQSGKQQRLAVFAPSLHVSQSALRHIQKLANRGRSASPDVFSHSSTGVVISHQLSAAIGSTLRSFQHEGVVGAGFYVPISPQLSLLG